jgi:glucose/arabinose dehydrogenase
VFIAEGSGRISIVSGGRRLTALAPRGGRTATSVAIALDPQVARNGLVYVIRAVLDGRGACVFNSSATAKWAARWRSRDPPRTASGRPDRCARRTGRGRAPFRSGRTAVRRIRGTRGRAPAQGAYNGKILRLNPDGTTPRDQRGASPVFATGARRPRGITWGCQTACCGSSTAIPSRPERLIAVAPGAGRPTPCPCPSAPRPPRFILGAT